MRLILIAFLLLAPLSAGAFSYATGGCATAGCDVGDAWLNSNANEIDTALDSLESTVSSHTSTISSLATTYLALSGGTITGGVILSAASIDLVSGAVIVANNGTGIEPVGTGYIYATAMSATGQIDDNDLAAGAVDLNTGEVEGTLPTTKGGTGATALTNLITLATHTTGNYVATIADSGASEVTVANSGTENAAVTLAIASTIARDSEVTAAIDLKSAATSTSGNLPKFSGTEGDLVDTGVAVDGSNNITTAGGISVGGSTGVSTFTMRNTADSGWVECGVVGTTMTCAVDADGTPDGTL